MLSLSLLFLAGVWAGAQNALAGGGSFITLPALMFAGLTPLQANITLTIALFPGQLAAGFANRKMIVDTKPLSFRALCSLCLAGSLVGAAILLVTPPTLFARLIPWFVLFATCVFAWGSFRKKSEVGGFHLGAKGTAIAQFITAIYVGYFGGGAGFLVLAIFSMAGLPARTSVATKNILMSLMNTAAAAILIFSPEVHWLEACVIGVGSILGGLAGAKALHHIPEKALRVVIVLIGIALTIGLFIRQGSL